MIGSTALTLNHLILYCRSGFEAECAQEIQTKATEIEAFGYAKTQSSSAYVVYECYEPNGAERIINTLSFDDLIFARQWFAAYPLIQHLPADDRVTPLLEHTQLIGHSFGYLQVETADTNEAKEVLGFCKKFTAPLSRALKQQKILGDNKQKPTLHAFFKDSSQCYLGYSPADNHSDWFMGIPRLKFPKAAPSRSTLKLEEAWLQFLSHKQQESELKAGMHAVDLGAAPGGWTWQFVNRSIRVAAIDNGPMNDELMDSGIVEHLMEDGFTYWPQKKVDWLVCDMVEQPIRIASLMVKWVSEGKADRALFNLKLPMKKRYPEVQKCFALIAEKMGDTPYQIQAKHLYHDREEITVYLKKTS